MLENSSTLAPLVELANLTDSPETVARFLAKYPTFIPSELDPPESGLDDPRFALFKSTALETALNDFRAHCSPSMEECLRRARVFFLRHQLRELWGNSGERADGIAYSLLFAAQFQESDATVYSPMGVDWLHGQLVYKPLDEFQAALYALLKCSYRAKVCARPGCSAPYFVANRITQQYCSTDCADAMQDEWRRIWWRSHGNEWRKKKNKNKDKKRKQQSKRRGRS
jgi:hypothetical protein